MEGVRVCAKERSVKEAEAVVKRTGEKEVTRECQCD